MPAPVDQGSIHDAIARLAVAATRCRSAVVLDLRDGLRVLAASGSPVGPEALSAALPLARLCADEGAPRRQEDRLALPHGDEALVLFGCSEQASVEDLGRVLGDLAAARGLTDEVTSLHGRVEALFDVVPGGLVTLDASWRVVGINASAAAALGTDRGVAIGRPLESIDGARKLMDALRSRRTLAEGETVALASGPVRVRMRPHRGGTTLHLDAVRPARAPDGVASRARYTLDDLVGQDPKLVACVRSAMQAARGDVPILITGESGTGKELLAQAVHNASPRADEPFVAINVAAIPAELLESELFGYESGAFTGADLKGRPGQFELAGAGTLLLDEIGEMPLEMQSKLLRVLQEQQIQRLGAARSVPLRARIIATTHQDMEQAVEQGRFRLDLYYRLRVVTLYLPPLRKRRGDVPLLIEHYLGKAAQRASRGPVTLAPHVHAQLQDYGWAGNVRELENMMVGLVSLLPPDVSRIEELPTFSTRQEMTPAPARRRLTPMPAVDAEAEPQPLSEPLPLDAVERGAIATALEYFQGNVSRAAEALAISRTTLYAKLKRYGLDQE